LGGFGQGKIPAKKGGDDVRQKFVAQEKAPHRNERCVNTGSRWPVRLKERGTNLNAEILFYKGTIGYGKSLEGKRRGKEEVGGGCGRGQKKSGRCVFLH